MVLGESPSLTTLRILAKLRSWLLVLVALSLLAVGSGGAFAPVCCARAGCVGHCLVTELVFGVGCCMQVGMPSLCISAACSDARAKFLQFALTLLWLHVP